MTSIYHITHLDNLPSIVAREAILCDQESRTQRAATTVIGYEHIKERRMRHEVPCGPRGHLGNYAPFYFAPRSPMLCAIHKGGVSSYQSGQKPIVHLVSSVKAVVTAGLAFVFTDGHADTPLTDYFEDLDDLEAVDWSIMRERYWADTVEDGDRKRRRQAEFLVRDRFPWRLVESIGVFDDTMKAHVKAAIVASTHRPTVAVRRDWYY